MSYRTANETILKLKSPSNDEFMGDRSTQEDYAVLATAEKAVTHIADGSTPWPALAVGMPGGLAKAVADRITAGNLKDLNLYYQHSMNCSEATLIRPEVLSKVNARCFFMGALDRKMVKLGISEGRKYLGYLPINFSFVPRALTEHIHVDTFVVTVSPMDKSAML